MTKRPSLLGIVEKKPGSASAPADVAPQPKDADASFPVEEDRVRVVVRLNLEAVEALEDITKELRRKTGKPVPIQRLMEQAVADLLRKYDRSAVVLPAPAKRAR